MQRYYVNNHYITVEAFHQPTFAHWGSQERKVLVPDELPDGHFGLS